MPQPPIRDVWVSQAVKHAPAHRIPHEHTPYDGEDRSSFVVACPPLLQFGGVAITREEARTLQVHPCVRCFDVKVAVLPPPPRACGRACPVLTGGRVEPEGG